MYFLFQTNLRNLHLLFTPIRKNAVFYFVVSLVQICWKYRLYQMYLRHRILNIHLLHIIQNNNITTIRNQLVCDLVVQKL